MFRRKNEGESDQKRKKYIIRENTKFSILRNWIKNETFNNE